MTDILNFLVVTFQGLYFIFSDLLGFGWGLIALSILSSLLFSPLESWASRLKNDELKIQKVLQPQIKKIKQTLSGKEAWTATQRLYNRYSYHPLMAIRTAAFPLLQLPVLFLAYIALSSTERLEGISVAIVADLSKPDNLLFGFALLPFLMTLINIAITFVGSFSKRERIQAVLIALFFLVLLYHAPSALLIYWTMNNLIGLIKVIVAKFSAKEKIFNLLNKIKTTPAWVWTLPLCPFVPISFLLANNATYYPTVSIGLSLLVVFTVSVICWFILNSFVPYSSKISRRICITLGVSYCLIIGFVLCSLSYSTIFALFFEYRFYVIIFFPLIFAIFVKLLRFKTINLLFLIQSIVSFCFFLHNYGLSFQTPIKSDIDTVSYKFKFKPNIYYFLCESYNNLSFVKNTFGYDSSKFIDYLIQHHYKIYDDTYSNSSYTLGTLTNIFTMNVVNSKTNAFLDASAQERSIIGGGKGNQLLKILKSNGYETSLYFKGNSYFFSTKGEYLDHTDIQMTVFDYLQPIKDTNVRMPQLVDWILSIFYKKNLVEQDSLTILKDHLARAKKTQAPQFFAHRLQKANHTDSLHYTYKNREHYIRSQVYQSGIRSGNEEIKTLVELIETEDPNAIIIFLGDHGAWTLRGFPINKPLNELAKELKKENLTLNMLINDLFYVFAAIKLPDNMGTIDSFSPSDLFSQLFCQLEQSSNCQKPIFVKQVKLNPYEQELLCYDSGNDSWYPCK